MNLLRRIMQRRNRGVVRTDIGSVEVEWHRNEELRPERLGPSPEDISPMDETEWRPKRTLRPH